MEITHTATLTCPACGAEHTETMSDSSCQFFYRCDACGVTLRPAEGDCCVFCTYADVPCPPIQRARRPSVRARCDGRPHGRGNPCERFSVRLSDAEDSKAREFPSETTPPSGGRATPEVTPA